MVSDYFPSDDIPIANIIATTVGCYQQLFQLSGSIEGPIPTPHEFIWRYSTDGSNWSTPSSNMVQFEIYLNFPVGTVLFFELKAGQEGGPWTYAYHSATVIENSPNCYRDAVSLDNHVIITRNEMYTIFPNPTSDYIKVVSIDNLDHDFDVTVFDLVNRTCLYLETCANECIIPTYKLSNGMYLLVIKNKSNDHVYTQKFYVVR